MRSLSSMFTILATFTVLACSVERKSPPPAPTDPAVVRQAIESANARFLAALNRRDSAGASANYTDDATVMMPNEPAWRGHEALSRGLNAFMTQFTVTGAAKTEDVMVSGDMAVETGTYEWTLQPKKGKAIKDRGKYLTAWKRQADGSWKIVRDINNSDLPGGGM